MKYEQSSGGIVYKKDKGQVQILVAQHSQHHGWVFPKGLIGDNIKGEKKENTAVREVEEETGIKAKIIQELEPVTFWYVYKQDPSASSRQEKIKKTVYYYIMKFIGGDTKNHDFEMENVEWLPIDQVLERLTYKSDQEVFIKARPLIENLVE